MQKTRPDHGVGLKEQPKGPCFFFKDPREGIRVATNVDFLSFLRGGQIIKGILQ